MSSNRYPAHRIVSINFAAFLLLSTVAFSQDEPSLESRADLGTRAVEVLKSRCYQCHGSSSRIAGLDVLDRGVLVENRGTPERPLAFITPGVPSESILMDAINSDFMPPTEAGEVTEDERQLLVEWIESGAEFPPGRNVQFVSTLTQLEAVRALLLAVDSQDRPFMRFFSIAHLQNNRSITEDDLRLYRAALSKTLHSLTWEREIHLPKVVPGTEESLLVIDLRDFGWEREGLWAEIMRGYRYGLDFEHVEDRALRNAGTDVALLTGADVPIVRADWFIVNATRPPLYHRLLEIPSTLGELEERLGVDFEQAFDRRRLMRAGFSRSGVSRQNRLLERHQPPNTEYYWISYDFFPRRERGDLIRFPLGPERPENPYEKFAFSHDGGEIIWRLPNGMQGYMLVAADGRRIDAGPIEVVFDAKSSLGSPLITNGVSCIHCHRNGMITEWRDEVREAAPFGGAISQAVRELYPPADEMARQVEQDRRSFLAALEQVCGPYLRVGDDADRAISDFPEPVGKVVEWYLRDLDLTGLACELGIEHVDELRERIRRESFFRELGLGPAAADPPGTVKREKWEGGSGRSLYHEVMVELQPGVLPVISLRQ